MGDGASSRGDSCLWYGSSCPAYVLPRPPGLGCTSVRSRGAVGGRGLCTVCVLLPVEPLSLVTPGSLRTQTLPAQPAGAAAPQSRGPPRRKAMSIQRCAEHSGSFVLPQKLFSQILHRPVCLALHGLFILYCVLERPDLNHPKTWKLQLSFFTTFFCFINM